jgi:hypothetical protein
VRFREEVDVETFEADAGAGDEVRSQEEESGLRTPATSVVAPRGDDSSTPVLHALNPARVLFGEPDTPLHHRPQYSTGVDPNDGEMQRMKTPRTDVESLLFGDVLRDLYPDVCADTMSAEDCVDANDHHEVEPEVSSEVDIARTPRFQLLRCITSQNALQVVQFDAATGELVANHGHFSADRPLLDRLCEEVLGGDAGKDSQPMREWLLMQLRWVLWTLAAHERREPAAYFGKLLRWPTVVECVRWRAEAYNASSSAPSAARMSLPPLPHAVTAGPESARKRRRTMYSSAFPSRNAITPMPSASCSAPIASSATLSVDAGERNSPLAVEVAPCALTSPTRPRRSAPSHFAKRGAMSPLQRCSDIACFVWPMVLCFSASAPEGAPSSTASPAPRALDNSAGKGGDTETKMKCFVTDGWWWTSAQLDADLVALYNKVRRNSRCT